MFADYTKQVHQDYLRKRDDNALPLSLIHPTPAGLGEQSIVVCTERYQRRDEKALKAFFGEGAEREACLKAIKRCKTDKFRPLVNFLNKRTGAPESKNIELLAWLIDFKDRPYELGRRYDSNTPEEPALQQEKSQTGNEIKDAPPSENPGLNEEKTIPEQTGFSQSAPNIWSRRTILLAMLLLAVISIGIYLADHTMKSGPVISGDGKCMYWTGDHYQQIPCNQKPDNSAMVIALDSEKLVHFRKITNTDTITHESLKTVWYVKINGNLEFYTSEGFHPIYQQLRLKPLTDHMIRIIHPIQEALQVSK